MIGIVKQRIKLDWTEDQEYQRLLEVEQAISATCGRFKLLITEHVNRHAGNKFSVLVISTTGSASGIFHENFVSLTAAVDGLEQWIQQTIFDLGAAITREDDQLA